MLFKDLLQFKKKFDESPPPVSLILTKEKNERKGAYTDLISMWKSETRSVVCIESEEFSAARFGEEVQTVPFLVPSVLVGISDIETLDLDLFEDYLKSPSSWVSLLLTASNINKASKLYKLIADRGAILQLGEDKPWEKEKKNVEYLVNRAASCGVSLDTRAAETMVKHLSTDPLSLRQELEKLTAFVFPKTIITAADVLAIGCKTPQVTLWRLGETLLAFETAACIKIAHSLLEEGMAPFPIIAHLRTQLRSALLTLMVYQEGGASLVTKQFPYLRGALLEKKLRLYQKYGERRLKKALINLFETELSAKNSGASVPLLLELFLIKSGI